MSSLILACVWGIAANVLAVIPSRDNYWTRAYFLIALGLPILGHVFYQHGLWITMAVLIAASSMLRWPVRYLWRWIRRQLTGVRNDPS